MLHMGYISSVIFFLVLLLFVRSFSPGLPLKAWLHCSGQLFFFLFFSPSLSNKASKWERDRDSDGKGGRRHSCSAASPFMKLPLAGKDQKPEAGILRRSETGHRPAPLQFVSTGGNQRFLKFNKIQTAITSLKS